MNINSQHSDPRSNVTNIAVTKSIKDDGTVLYTPAVATGYEILNNPPQSDTLTVADVYRSLAGLQQKGIRIRSL